MDGLAAVQLNCYFVFHLFSFSWNASDVFLTCPGAGAPILSTLLLADGAGFARWVFVARISILMLELMSAESGLKPELADALSRPPSFENIVLPEIDRYLGEPGQRHTGACRNNSTHNTLEKRYFSGWPAAYLRIPSF